MKKVITFSLWGTSLKYCIGAIKNIDIAKKYYPDFECWIYIHIETVPNNIVNEIKKRDNVKIIFKSGDLNTCKPMMWRFEAIDDNEVEIMMSRDTDTRIYIREKEAVDEWLSSDKLFHIMRDHPAHGSLILGGMFGTRKISEIKSWTKIIDTFVQNGIRQYDQDFLVNYIYPKIKNDSIIHASFCKFEGNLCKNFPSKYDEEYHFVGEYVYEDDTRNIDDINTLKQNLH
jgi:hypothetical protein